MTKFYWNGIKGADGKLQAVFYSLGRLSSKFHPETITIYARSYRPLTKDIREQFNVRNDSDPMTDYHETDTIYVSPDHPLYSDVLKAFYAAKEHDCKVAAKRAARRAA